MSRTVEITVQQAAYAVKIKSGLLEQLGEETSQWVTAGRCCLVTDSNVAPLYLERAEASLKAGGFCVSTMVLPAGEASKNSQTYLQLLSFLVAHGITRNDPVIALGGGVVSDLAGFAAATYLRGVPLILVPTTLLAMVDASIGGKTAIDLEAGKNLAGAIYQPKLVLTDPALLKTLPAVVFADGMSEVIKYGMISDPEILTMLQQEDWPVEALIFHCVKQKAKLIQQDPLDYGLRRLLNFGHTVGHAIEACNGYHIGHGAAVAAGMAILTRSAVRQGVCPAACYDVLESLLAKFGLPTETVYETQALVQAASFDKKRQDGALTLVVPQGVGACRLKTIPLSQLEQWIEMGRER